MHTDRDTTADSAKVVRARLIVRLISKEGLMKTKSSRFDRLVARYYPAVYSFASRLTDDPRKAIALALISAVIRAGLAPA
jgi:hypothetical protein